MLKTIYLDETQAVIVDMPLDQEEIGFKDKGALVDAETGYVKSIDAVAKFLKFNPYLKPVGNRPVITDMAATKLSDAQIEEITASES